MMNKNSNYIKSLDGLRALAVLLVIGYHFRLPLFKGGFIGVDIFFVLSGYLITSQILYKLTTYHSFSIKEFWVKRLKRLYPALIGLIICVSLFVVIKTPNRWGSIIQDDLAGIFGVSNWWYIIKKVPYADTFSHPAPLKHLWSLAVEAQYYLLLPLLFIGNNTVKTKKKHALLLIVSMIIISVLAMSYWYSPGDINRAYYGTDTRLFSLLIGSLTAYFYPYQRLSNQLPIKTAHLFESIGSIVLAAILLFVVRNNEFQASLYHGGFFLISLLTALLMCIVIHPGTRLNTFFSNNLLAWIGKRSYSLYLWHYPIIVLMTPMKITGIYHIILMVFQFILMIVLAEMSYKYIETPLRRADNKFFSHLIHTIKRSKTFLLETLLIVITIVGIFFTTIFFDKMVDKSTDIAQNKVVKETAQKKEPIKKIEIDKIYMIGDSVILGSKTNIKERMPEATVDAKVGRQFIDLPQLLKKKYLKQLNDQSLVFISLGTNGPFESEDIENVYQLISEQGAHLVLLNTYVPLNWQNEVNGLMKKFAAKHSDVLVIDWHDYIADKLAYLEQDGVHPTVEGRELLANLIFEELTEYYELPKNLTEQPMTTTKE